MTFNGPITIVPIVLMIVASTFLAFGTNIFIGLSLFFAIWAIGVLIVINR